MYIYIYIYIYMRSELGADLAGDESLTSFNPEMHAINPTRKIHV